MILKRVQFSSEQFRLFLDFLEFLFSDLFKFGKLLRLNID